MHIFKDKAIFFPGWILAIFHLTRVYKSLCWSAPLPKIVIVRFLHSLMSSEYKIVSYYSVNIHFHDVNKNSLLFLFICRDMYICFFKIIMNFLFLFLYLIFVFFSCWVKIFLKVIPFLVIFQKSSSGLWLVFFFSLWFISKSSFWYFCLLRQCLLFLDSRVCENRLIKIVNPGFRFAFMFKTLIHLELIFCVLGNVKIQFQNNFPGG